MGRARVLIVIALLIVVGAIAAVFLLGDTGGGGGNQPQSNNQPQVTRPPTEIPATPVPTIALVEILVAVQDIDRGSVIPPDAVRLQAWPLVAAPYNAVASVEDVIGKRARTDIFVEQPILFSMVVDDLTDAASVGSDAAAIIPSGLVGISFPVDRLTSVSYAIQPGDRVDVIISLLFVDIDETFQSLLPNQINLVNTNIDENGIQLSTGSDINGRFETVRIPLSGFNPTTGTTQQIPVDWPVLVKPTEESRPRLVTQRTVLDALVIHVGDFPADGKLFEDIPTPTPIVIEPTRPAGASSAQGQAAAPIPTVEPPRPTIVTLAVTPQEAVILTWMIEARIPIQFALRSASDTSQVPTDPVTLEYIMSEYDITVPAKRGFSIQPAIRSIRQLLPANPITAE